MSVSQLLSAVPASESAFASVQSTAADVLTFSAGRIGASLGALAGLVGVALGVWTLLRIRAGKTASGRRNAVVALASALLGLVLGGVVVATSDSGIGTGNGRGGAYVALIVGVIALVVGAVTLARSRRAD